MTGNLIIILGMAALMGVVFLIAFRLQDKKEQENRKHGLDRNV